VSSRVWTGLLPGRALSVLGVRTRSGPSPEGVAEIASGATSGMGRSTSQGTLLSNKRKYRKFTVAQKAELVLASFRGDRSIAEICREHDISETLVRRWRDQMIAARQGRPLPAPLRAQEPRAVQPSAAAHAARPQRPRQPARLCHLHPRFAHRQRWPPRPKRRAIADRRDAPDCAESPARALAFTPTGSESGAAPSYFPRIK
jgi:transposase-like protein